MLYRIGLVILFSFGLHLAVSISTAGNEHQGDGEKTLLGREGERDREGFLFRHYMEEYLSKKTNKKKHAEFISH